jgi:hypothetical protein
MSTLRAPASALIALIARSVSSSKPASPCRHSGEPEALKCRVRRCHSGTSARLGYFAGEYPLQQGHVADDPDAIFLAARHGIEFDGAAQQVVRQLIGGDGDRSAGCPLACGRRKNC